MKKMFVVLAVLVLSIGFIGCPSSTDPGNGDGDKVTIPIEYHGTWHTDDGEIINDAHDSIYRNRKLTVVIDATSVKVRSESWVDPTRWWTFGNFSSSHKDENWMVYVLPSQEVRLYLGNYHGIYLGVEIREPEAPNFTTIVYGDFTK